MGGQEDQEEESPENLIHLIEVGKKERGGKKNNSCPNSILPVNESSLVSLA